MQAHKSNGGGKGFLCFAKGVSKLKFKVICEDRRGRELFKKNKMRRGYRSVWNKKKKKAACFRRKRIEGTSHPLAEVCMVEWGGGAGHKKKKKIC